MDTLSIEIPLPEGKWTHYHTVRVQKLFFFWSSTGKLQIWQTRLNGNLPCLKENRWEKTRSLENCPELQEKKILCLKVKFLSKFHVFSLSNFFEIGFDSKLCHSCTFHFFIWKRVRGLHSHKPLTFPSNQFDELSFPDVVVSIHLKTKSVPEN